MTKTIRCQDAVNECTQFAETKAVATKHVPEHYKKIRFDTELIAGINSQRIITCLRTDWFLSLVSSRTGVFSKKEMAIIFGVSAAASAVLYVLYAAGR